MWYLRTWFSVGLGGAELTVGLDDLKGLFQLKLFCDSVILLEFFQQLPVKQNVSKCTSIVFPSALVTGYEKTQTSGKQEIPVERQGNYNAGLCLLNNCRLAGWGLVDVKHLSALLASSSSCV